MRIVHISTHDVIGGAARAALRLHQALLAAGEASTMLVRWKLSSLDSVVEARVPETMPTWWGDLAQTRYIDCNRSALSNTFFSLGWPGHDLSGHPAVREAEVIHLHWVSCFQSPATLAALLRLGKPVVWTLHDQRPFTGGCHFPAGCARFEKDCARCPQLATDPARLTAGNLGEQRRCYAAVAPICLVAPSRWMAECARRSALFRRARIEVVPYGVDTRAFRPMPRVEARQKLGLPGEGLLLLFGARELAERRKGVAELAQALELSLQAREFQHLAATGRVGLVSFGNAGPELAGLKLPVRSLGQVDSDETLRAIYSAANAFLAPALEDNLPNTVLESLSCGTPVVGFSAGGIPELVTDGKTGYLARPGDVRGLSRILSGLPAQEAQLDSLAAACRRQAEDHFTLARQAEDSVRLYRHLLEKTVAIAGAAPAAPRATFEMSFSRALRWVLREHRDLFDVVDIGIDDPAEARFRRQRVYRLMGKHLKKCGAGRLPLDQLLAQLDADLASISEPAVSPLDRARLALGRFLLYTARSRNSLAR